MSKYNKYKNKGNGKDTHSERNNRMNKREYKDGE